MSSQNLTPADIFVNSLKAQRNGALDMVALRDAEVAGLKGEIDSLKDQLLKITNEINDLKKEDK